MVAYMHVVGDFRYTRDQCRIRHYYNLVAKVSQIYHIYVCASQALTGGSIEVPTLDGRKITVSINEIVRYVWERYIIL